MKQNRGIRFKLIAGLLSVALLALLAGIIGTVTILKSNSAQKKIYETKMVPVGSLMTISANFIQIQEKLAATIKTNSSAEVVRFSDEIEGLRGQIIMGIVRYKSSLSDSEKEEFEPILGLLEGFYSDAEDLMIAASENNDSKAISILNGSMAETASKFAQMVEATSSKHLQMAESFANTEYRNSKRGLFIMGSVFIVTIIVSLFGGVFLSYRITDPLIKGVGFAQNIAKGDLTQELDIRTKDELQTLAEALNAMVKNLREAVGSMASAAEQTAASSEQEARTAQSLSEGAQRQAAALEESTSSMVEVSRSIKLVSDKIVSQAHSVEQVNNSTKGLESSIVKVAEMSDHVKDSSTSALEKTDLAQSTSSETRAAMKEVEASSLQIVEILDVIADIADQTHLLSLNASIEAARAGESGRGFAVVAKEISKLADKSAEATKEIERLINLSSENVRNGVDKVHSVDLLIKDIRDAVHKAVELGRGMSIIAKSQLGFSKEIVDAVSSINTTAKEIAKDAEGQSAATDELAKTLESVNLITQQTSASAEELASSTEELSAQAIAQKKMASQFKLS